MASMVDKRHVLIADGMKAGLDVPGVETPGFYFDDNTMKVQRGFEMKSGSYKLDDNLLSQLGTDGDGVLVLRSAILNTNTALANVLLGTPVTPALAANSVILSNITASGDFLVAANNGGNSQAWLWIDSSAGLLTLYGAGVSAVEIGTAGVVFNEASADRDFRIEGNGDANLLMLDAGEDAIGIGSAAVTKQKLTVTNGVLDPIAGRLIKLSGSMAAPNMADGYGMFEVDMTLSGTMGATGFANAASAWVNIPTGTVGAGKYVCARNDGVYEASAATITNAKIVFGARMHKLLDDTDALSFPFSLNTNNTAITALFDVANSTDLGTVANAGSSAATLVPFCRDSNGTLKYVLLYNLA